MIVCCCGHEHDEITPCSVDGCECVSWHWYDHKHWSPQHAYTPLFDDKTKEE